jgi:hypothetical protein
MHGNHKYTWGRSRIERERLVAAALEYFKKKQFLSQKLIN